MKLKRTIFADWNPSTAGFTPDGTIDKPFRTIQDAVNAAVAMAVPPSLDNPVTIVIMQGIYEENVFIDQDGLVLRGMGGLGTVRIKPNAGPAVIVSNATRASVDQYLATNDRGALQSGSRPSPQTVQFFDLGFESSDSSASVVIVGKPDTTRRLADLHYIMFSHCEFWGATSLHAYFTNMIWLRHNSEVYGATEIFNCGGIWVDDSGMGGFNLEYDVNDPFGTPVLTGYGQPRGQFGLVGLNAFFIGNVEVRGNSPLRTPQPTIDSSFWDISVRDRAQFNMIGGYCNSVTTDGGAMWTGQDVHIQTNLTFGAGAGHVQLDGGRYMGTLKDPGAKFVRNIGK